MRGSHYEPTPEERERRQRAIKALNEHYWLAAHEAAATDPAWAKLTFGLDDATVAWLSEVTIRDLQETLATMTTVMFAPRCTENPADLRESPWVAAMHLAIQTAGGRKR